MKKLFTLCIWFLMIAMASVQAQSVAYISAIEDKAFILTKEPSPEILFSLLLNSPLQAAQKEPGSPQQRFEEFTCYLQKERLKFPSEGKYIKWMVEEVRKQFLHDYELYPSFQQLFTSGTYNCLSGTALYGLILQKLSYQVEIHETAFHAYLIIHTPKRKLLLDATDAENGFAYYAYQIRARETLYRENERARYQPAFNRVIDFYELAGLHYYNEAIIQFNAQNYTESLKFLDKAAQLYPRSERIQHLQANAMQGQRRFERSQVAQKSNNPTGVSDIQMSELTQR